MNQIKLETRGRKRNDELIRRRKREILHSAARVFAEFGYDGSDVEQIADNLEISKGTIYRYFPSKEKLFLAALDQEVERLQNYVVEAIVEVNGTLAQFTCALDAFLTFFHENPHAIELLMLERAKFRDRDGPTYLAQRRAELSHWRVLIEKLIADGYFRSMPIECMLDMLANLIYGAIFLNRFHENRSDLSTQSHAILDVLMSGYATQKAHDELSRNTTESTN